MPRTAALRVLSRKAGEALEARDIAVVPVDGAVATDATARNERVGNLHTVIRRFAREHSTHFYEIGNGICHKVMME